MVGLEKRQKFLNFGFIENWELEIQHFPGNRTSREEKVGLSREREREAGGRRKEKGKEGIAGTGYLWISGGDKWGQEQGYFGLEEC